MKTLFTPFKQHLYNLIIIVTLLCFATSIYAQVVKTANVATPGTLSTVASTYLGTVTNLTVTGTIDAQDFKTMRDNMPVLAVIDISSVTIAAYTGTAGTAGTTSQTYSENELPMNSFYSTIGNAKTTLKTITLPNSVTSIGSFAFQGCSGLSSVTFPLSVTSIGDKAFIACSGLTSITIPSSITSIGSSSFAICTGLTSVTIPTSVTSIGSSAFYNCTGLTSVTIPSSVTSIGGYTFYNCTGLTSVTIPSSVTSIGSNAFSSCTGLTSITIPSSVTSIGSYAFSSCTGLTSITIPSSVTSIESYTFSSCTGLTSFTIPSSVSSIGTYAFEHCTGLTSITIPSSVTSIGSYAFYYCSKLTSINAYPTIPVDLTSLFLVFYNVDKTTCILYVSPYSLSLYKSANQWKDFINIISIPNIITTTSITNITTTTASGGGNITSDGGFPVTARGVCWSTTANPTISNTNNKTADSSGTGTFISNITGLISGTTYYFRAYATNSTGTAYGSVLTFKTLTNTDVTETNIEDIDYYPNPTNGIININIGSGNFTDCLVNITNSLGQKVYNSKLYTVKTTLDLTKISKSGLLFIQIINSKGAVIGEKKILIE
jgi:hypothetical protein